MAFSMMSDMTLVLTVASGVLTVVMGVLLWKLKKQGQVFCAFPCRSSWRELSGNLIDRIFCRFRCGFYRVAFC